jgi:endonuclease YncB( thermonuclease family)
MVEKNEKIDLLDCDVLPVNDNEKLIACTYNNTPRFNFIGKTFNAKCVKVYDGDSITVVFMVYGEYYKFSIRMYGYDSPEIHSKNTDADIKKQEQKWAHMSKEVLSNMIMDKIITLTCKDYDKYGRIVGVVDINNININDYMLSKGYCRVYGGGRKHVWDFSPFEEMLLENDNVKQE